MAKKIKPIPGFPETEEAPEIEESTEAEAAPVVAAPAGFLVNRDDVDFVIEALDEHYTRRVSIEGKSAEPLKNKADALVAELKAYVGQS